MATGRTIEPSGAKTVLRKFYETNRHLKRIVLDIPHNGSFGGKRRRGNGLDTAASREKRFDRTQTPGTAGVLTLFYATSTTGIRWICLRPRGKMIFTRPAAVFLLRGTLAATRSRHRKHWVDRNSEQHQGNYGSISNFHYCRIIRLDIDPDKSFFTKQSCLSRFC